MPVIRADQIDDVIRRTNSAVFRAIVAGAKRGALKGERHIVPRTKVDRGDLRRSWRVIRRSVTRGSRESEAAQLINDAPHAGIIEGGARPHAVSREGVESIKGWVRRHFAEDEQGVNRIAWGIVKKLKTRGQRATWFVRDELAAFRDLAGEAVHAGILRVSKQPQARKGG